MTDGDLNCPAYSLEAKTRAILGPEGHHADLSIVAIAPRLNVGADRLLQDLADSQDGTYLAEPLDGGAPLLTSADGMAKPAAATP